MIFLHSVIVAFLKTIIIMLFVGFIGIIIATIMLYFKARIGCTGKISFDRFLKCYYTKDCEFGLRNGYICAYIFKYGKAPHAVYDKYSLYFSFIDFIRYIWWKWNKERNEKKLLNNENMNKVNEYLNSKLEEHKDV